MNMNFEQARNNMVKQQIRPWDVIDHRVLETLDSIQREDFAPARYRKLAYADMAIPLDHGQQMMHPVIEGRLLQAIDLQTDETVLEIGTGSGFLSACLARLGKAVCSVDIHPELSLQACKTLKSKKINNIECFTGDALNGWMPEQAHDVVVVTGGVREIPKVFMEWVNPGGRLFIISGNSPAMEVRLLKRLNISDWENTSLFETDLPLLVNAEKATQFQF
ncbi:MAG: protein-L-isoaspartate O-methyltransferase [Xanthomonadales bacterium]|nr:protein-L-isoaspartate O-methyltransferase [Xanthomonadales bacterium]